MGTAEKAGKVYIVENLFLQPNRIVYLQKGISHGKQKWGYVEKCVFI